MSHWKNLPQIFTRAYFTARAKAMRVLLGDIALDVPAKAMKTGSLGWNTQAKRQVAVGDAMVWCQIQVTVVVIGSAALPVDPGPVQGGTHAPAA